MATPLSSKQKPKVAKRLHLRPDEAQRLIKAAGERGRYPFRDKVLVRMTYRHGLRAAEAVGLRWDQVDLDNGILYVSRSKGGNQSTHTMERDELRDLRKLRKDAGTSVFLFETERGGPLSVDALQYIVREAGKLAKLDVEAHPHMLRHAAGYCLINEGVDVRLVQDFLGHKNIGTTAHYTALAPNRLAALRVR
jgi:type 1 fimbriae regulatory protein FimE